MYITSSKSYQQILLSALKVIGVVAIFVGPIALIQVISASRPYDIKREIQDENLRGFVGGPKVVGPDALGVSPSETGNIGQLGELFDVSQRKDRRDSRSILRLRRQTNDEPLGPTLAQLTAAGTAAGMMLGDQVAGAQLAAAAGEANEDPEQISASAEDDESDANGSSGQGVDLSTLQSLEQAAPQQNQLPRQQGQEDNVNPEQMPDSMESLMRSEQEDMGADGSEAEQPSSEQPSASSPVAGNQQALTEADEDDIEQDDSNNQNSLSMAANLPGSYLPVQRELIRDGPNALGNGVAFSNGLTSPIIDLPDDLNAAAGHHYKKKKMKKKKLKKIIIKKKKKGKKYKKLKKVKIIKYKKKKVMKKKPKKLHHHHPQHDHGKYYMYAKVPKKKSWEFGFKKGNKKHWIERHEKGHKNKFKTKVKWFDKKSKGKGVHIWDYNHHDKKKKKHY